MTQLHSSGTNKEMRNDGVEGESRDDERDEAQ